MIFIMLSTIGAESDSLLQILDDIIPQRNRYSDERIERIATELLNLENATSDENRYGICRVLYCSRSRDSHFFVAIVEPRWLE